MADQYTARGIAASAANLVDGDRARQHGDAETGFSRIGRLWAAYLGLPEPIAAHDVAMLLGLLKVGRTQQGAPNLDNYIDLAGYAALAGQIKMRVNP